MAIRTPSQIRKKISVSEFKDICIKHETFLFHLYVNYPEDEPYLETTFQSLEKSLKRKRFRESLVDPMESFLKSVNLPYFEIPMEEGYPIMLDYGYSNDFIFDRIIKKFRYAMILIHKGKIFHNTQFDCYCVDSVIDAIGKLDINLLKLDD
jgi:hypothetical protein